MGNNNLIETEVEENMENANIVIDEEYVKEDNEKKDMISNMKNKTFFGYVRQSIKGRSDNTIELQTNNIIKFAKNAVGIDKNQIIFLEEEESAYGYDNENELSLEQRKNQKKIKREKFNYLMNELEKDSLKPVSKRVYGGAIFLNVSRISRNEKDFVRVSSIMRKGYGIYCVQEKIVDSPSGLLLFRILQAFSIYYSDDLSNKQSMYGIKKILDKSEVSLRPLFGYKELKKSNGEKDIVIDEDEAAIVRKVFKLYYENKIILKHKYNFIDVYNDLIEEEDIFKQIAINAVNKKGGIGKTKNNKISAFIGSILNNPKITGADDNDKIKYNGQLFRSQKIEFQETVNSYNLEDGLKKLGNEGFSLNPHISENEFIKGRNFILTPKVNKLRIIKNDTIYNLVLEDIMERVTTQKRDKLTGLYTGKIHCSCGNSMRPGQIGTKEIETNFFLPKNEDELKKWKSDKRQVYSYTCVNKECEFYKEGIREDFIDNYFVDNVLKYIKGDKKIEKKIEEKLLKGLFSGVQDFKKSVNSYSTKEGEELNKYTLCEKYIGELQIDLKYAINNEEEEILNKKIEVREIKKSKAYNLYKVYGYKKKMKQAELDELTENLEEYKKGFISNIASNFEKDKKKRFYKNIVIDTVLDSITVSYSGKGQSVAKGKLTNYWVKQFNLEDLKLKPFFKELYLLNRFLQDNEK